MALDLMSLRAGLFLDDSQYKQGLSDAKGGLQDFAASAKKVLAAVGFGVAVKKGVDGIVSLTKSAVKAYGEFEQLSGGVETLFKDSADAVKKHAQEAYKTAGLSANEYMETVTSFSASLIQSTGRGEQKDIAALKKNLDDQYDATKRHWEERIRLTKDSNKKASLRYQMQDELKALKAHNKEAIAEAERTNRSSKSTSESIARAADLADLAVRDMSDNANKFGSDMSSIQNAYAGFSKQNYTMLDNLKLGYGGTKEEMERLLQDAEKLTGKKYDLSSYADIVEAIHAIQDEMGITGTTAAEAEKTIEGSIASTKAAWQNVLTSIGSGKDMKTATANLVKSARNVLNNVKPVVKRALKGLGGLFEQLVPVVLTEVPHLILEFAPTVISSLGNMLRSIAKTLPGAVSKAWNDIKNVILTNGVQKFSIFINELITGGSEKGFGASQLKIQTRLTKLFSEIFEKVENVFAIYQQLFNDVLLPVFQTVLDFLLDKVLPIVNSALSLINNGLSAVPSIISDVVNAVKEGDWGKVGSIIWNSIKSGFKAVSGWLLKLVLGKDYTPESGWGEAGAKIWDAIKAGFKVVKGWLLKLVLGDKYTPDSGWGDAGAAIWGAIKDGFAVVNGWLLQLVLGNKYTPEAGWGEAGAAIWGAIKDGFAIVNDWLIKLVLGEKWTPEAGWGEAGAKIWQAIKDGFAITSDWLKKLLLGEDEYEADATWADVGKKIWDKIIEGLSSAVDWLKDLLDDWTTKLSDGTVDFEKIGSTIGGTIWGAIKDAFNTVIDWFKHLFGGESDDDENSVKGAIFSIDWAGLGTSIFNFIGNAFIGIAKVYEGYFKSAWLAIAQIDWAGLGKAMWAAIRSGFGTVSEWFEDTFREPVNKVIDYINEMITNFENAFNRVIASINSLLGTNFESKVFSRVQKISKDTSNKRSGAGRRDLYGGAGRRDLYGGAGRHDLIGYATGGVLYNGDSGIVGEYQPEFLQVVNGKAVVTPLNMGRFPGGGQEIITPRAQKPQMIDLTLQIKDTEIARVLVPLLETEEQRRGVRLATGGAY